MPSRRRRSRLRLREASRRRESQRHSAICAHGGVAHGRFLARLALVTQETPQLFGFLTSTHFAARHLLPALAERVRDGYAGLARALADEDAAGTGELERRALLRLLYAAGVELSDAEVRRGLLFGWKAAVAF